MSTRTAIDRFQEATCYIGERDYIGATKSLRAAVRACGPRDGELREDLLSLLASCEAKTR